MYFATSDVRTVRRNTPTHTHISLSDSGKVRGRLTEIAEEFPANMIDFMIALSSQLVFMLSRHAKSFQHDKWHKKGEWRGGRQPAAAFTLKPTSFLTLVPPNGTFNGMKLWACKSDNNCLGLKHNTLTGLTWPFSPPPLAPRGGHLL